MYSKAGPHTSRKIFRHWREYRERCLGCFYIPHSRALEYTEKCRKMSLLALSTRCVRENQTYKILKGN